jgi:hypothetical protein
MTTAPAAILAPAPVEIDLPEFTRLDATVGWERRLVLDTEARTVEVRESVGNGRPEREWYGLDPVLANLPLDLASFDRIATYLRSERAQTLLADLCVGGPRSTEERVHAVERLNDAITEAVEATPRYWDAGDFFEHSSDDELFAGVTSVAGLEQRASALCEEAARDGQRLVVSEVRDYLRRQWTDAVTSVRDDLTDDDDELFAEVDAGEWTLDDLAACVRDGRRSLSLVAIGAVLAERLAARAGVSA